MYNSFKGVSVDTNVFIHLYKSGHENLLYENFGEIYVYEYIIEEELKRNSFLVYQKVQKRIEQGDIILIDRKYIVDKGLIEIFDENYDDCLILFARDRGEAYAVALARALGIQCFITNDIKQGGPYETLVKEYIEEVIPFTFYEILFFKYLKGDFNKEEFKNNFDSISNIMEHPMDFCSKVNSVIRRFIRKDSKERDKKLLRNIVLEYQIDLKEKINELREYLKLI